MFASLLHTLCTAFRFGAFLRALSVAVLFAGSLTALVIAWPGQAHQQTAQAHTMAARNDFPDRPPMSKLTSWLTGEWLKNPLHAGESNNAAAGDLSINSAFMATYTTQIPWGVGSQGCYVCGGTYTCNNSSDWNNGTRTFVDPVPAGNTVKSAIIQVFGTGCSNSNNSVFLNNVFVGTFGITNNCACESCFAFPTVTLSNTNGIPGYVYGGTNTVQIVSGGTICVSSATITLATEPPACSVPPAISTQPVPQTGSYGSPVSFSVTASGTGPFTYQWYRLDSLISGANGSTYTFTPTSSFQATRYYVRVSNDCGAVISNQVNLTLTCPTITLTPPATNTGVAGTLFSQTFTQTGAIGTASFFINSGFLPVGLSLGSNGVLSGTPTQTGTFNIGVRAFDSSTNCISGTVSYSLTISCQNIAVTPPAVGTATRGTPFSQSFTQSGGIGATNFSMTATIPGLTLSGSGVLSGTPTGTGSYFFPVTATDSNGCTGVAYYSLSIACQTITVTPPATNTASAGAAFSQTFTQTGGIGAISFSLGSALPAGLDFDFVNGVLSGTPTQTGTFNISVNATDAAGCSGTIVYTLTIGCQVISVTPPATTNGTSGAAFNQSFTQSGGIGTTTFSTASVLPVGITLSSSGLLSGTPTQTGTFPITVTATDSNGCTGSAGYTLTIGCQTITVTAPATNSGTASAAFSQMFTQSGGIGATTFSTVSTLPVGITLSSSGLLSGTPTQTGTFPITVTATDSNGCTGSAGYTLTIGCQTITVNAPATNSGTASAAFSQTFTQSGGIGTTTFSTVSTLPAGITISSGGALSGTPTQTGSFNITVTATDSNGCTGSAGYTLIIGCQTITVGPGSIASGNPGVPYSQQFNQSGGIGTTTFSTASTLPTGIMLSTGGLLAGMTNQTGSFPVTILATDSNGCVGTANYTLTFSCPAITVTAPAVSTGTAGAAFSQSFTQSGGTAETTFSTGGPLPNGLALSAGGVLSGAPTQTGTFPITVTATSSGGCTGMVNYTLTITCQTITVTPPAVATGTASVAFSQSFTQLGAIGGASFSATSALPPGLTLSSAGVLGGTPTQAGTFPITVKVTDANGCMGTSATYNLVINCPAITLSPASASPPTDLPGGQAGVVYSQTIVANPAGTAYAYAVTDGALPTGLTLSSGGTISGTTNLVGVFTFTITATGWGNCTGSRQYRLATNCPTITLPSLPGGTASTPYSQTLTATPNGGNYSFAVTAGSLPPGLSLASSGAITGTPATAGTFSFTVTATGFGNCTGSRAYSMLITCPAITLSPASLPNATVNTAYSQTVSAAPLGTTYSFSVTSGALPSGLSLNASTGAITGSPAQSGTFNFRIAATGWGDCAGFRDYTLIVGCSTIAVTPATLPGGTLGAAYNQTVSATPAGTYNYSVTSGALTPGLTLNASTGAITGTPTTLGTFNFTITASSGGAGSCSGSRNYTIAIGCQGITISTTTLPPGNAGTAYSQTLSVTPAGSYTFSLSQGSLPSGLSLHPNTGVISGMPAATGASNFTIKVKLANGCETTQALSITINCPAVAIAPATLPNGTTGTAYSQSISATPAGGSYTYVVTSGSLPAGINLNTNTGILSGTPTTNGSSTFTIKATGFGGCTGNQTYTLVVGTGGGCPTISLPDLPWGSVGQFYNSTVGASPAGSYSYEVTAGSLPPGLTLFGSFGLLYGHPSSAGNYTFTITATAGACTGSRQYSVLIVTGFASSLTVFSDFDGDGKSDLSVWRGSDGNWLVANSGDGQLQSTPWGSGVAPYSDLAVSGDYDGDGRTDRAVFRRGGEQAGYWHIKRSSDGQTISKLWGLGTDVPVPGDYDGDGSTDIAVWRASEGAWYILHSSDGAVVSSIWGEASAGDIPVQGDYDGDGSTDVAVFRRGINGQQGGDWHIKLSSTGQTLSKLWGTGKDVAVPGDYDGDGKTDFAVWRGSEGRWYIESGTAQLQTVTLGSAALGDVPVVADYDGDGKADPAVWRASTGTWTVKRSSDGAEMSKAHGQSGDVPVMARGN